MDLPTSGPNRTEEEGPEGGPTEKDDHVQVLPGERTGDGDEDGFFGHGTPQM